RSSMKVTRVAAVCAALVACVSAWAGLKVEMRQPWQRDTPNYIRGWKQAGAFKCDLARDCLDIAGGDGAVAYAFATVQRAAAGKAMLSIGSSDGIRVWLNGKSVLVRDAHRSLTPDEDSLELDFLKGANTLLIKAAATASFTARVLEAGTVLARATEIGPSLIELQPEMFTVRTDVDKSRAAADPVTVEVIKAGGDVAFSATAKRGELVVVDAKGWPEGAYEVRARTLTPTGLRYVTYLAWF